MLVIARNDGPHWNGATTGHLTIGKKYNLISYFKHNGINYDEIYIKKNEIIFLPLKTSFYINVISDRGIKETFWNDYFLSTVEMRKQKLKTIYE